MYKISRFFEFPVMSRPNKKMSERKTILDQMDDHFSSVLFAKTQHASGDLYERFPKQMRDGLAHAKQCYFTMFDHFSEALTEIPYFDDVFGHNTKKGFLDGMDKEHNDKLMKMEPRKQIMVAEVISAILSGIIPNFSYIG